MPNWTISNEDHPNIGQIDDSFGFDMTPMTSDKKKKHNYIKHKNQTK